MASLVKEIRKRAFEMPCQIGLIDGEDERVIQAASFIKQNSMIEPVLIGNHERILSKMEALDISELLGMSDPLYSNRIDDYVQLYIQKQLAKGKDVPDRKEIEEKLRTPSYYAAMLLETGQLDGVVGGAAYPTAEILKAGLDVIGLAEDSQVVSGSFVMILNQALPGGQEAIVFSDCAVVPQPNSKQLASIALNAVKVARKVVGVEPRIALLSFSTLGSARHPLLENVKRAKEQIAQQYPHLIVEGEIQADAAIIPEVAQKKAPHSPLGGLANVLIFPDLNAGNIAYKLVERMAGAKALGVILEGFKKPLNDLSRGCSTEDVIDMICVTALQTSQTEEGSVHGRHHGAGESARS